MFTSTSPSSFLSSIVCSCEPGLWCLFTFNFFHFISPQQTNPCSPPTSSFSSSLSLYFPKKHSFPFSNESNLIAVSIWKLCTAKGFFGILTKFAHISLFKPSCSLRSPHWNLNSLNFLCVLNFKQFHTYDGLKMLWIEAIEMFKSSTKRATHLKCYSQN